MAFDEVQFPTTLSEKLQSGPALQTSVTGTPSGAEQRIEMQSRARLYFSLEPTYMDEEEMTEILGFFRARRGRSRGFRLRDESDYVATQEALTNPYPSAGMQLVKTYSSGGQSEVRKIAKPVAGSVVLERNTGSGWATWASSGNWSLDATTGIVTITTPASGHLYRWSGEFDVPARFDTDRLNVKLSSGIVTGDAIPLVEVLL